MWTFTATDANDVATVSDGNYFTMGWWMNEPLASNGAYTFGPYATGTNPVDSVMGSTASGRASYAGTATGLFASRARTGATMQSGAFVADAELSANLDTDMLSGTIDSFRDANGAGIAGWAVSLDSASIGNSQARPGGSASGVANTSTTSGAGAGGLGWSGTWDAWFVGGSASGSSHPNAVVGTFGARTGGLTAVSDGNGGRTAPTTGAYSSVEGAFGANRQ